MSANELRHKHVKTFVDWCKTRKGLRIKKVCQPWMEAEVFTGKVWEAVYYAPTDTGRKYPRVGRGLRPLVRQFNQERQSLTARMGQGQHSQEGIPT